MNGKATLCQAIALAVLVLSGTKFSFFALAFCDPPGYIKGREITAAAGGVYEESVCGDWRSAVRRPGACARSL